MRSEDTYLVRLPKDFPLARLACIASQYGYKFLWKDTGDVRTNSFEVVSNSQVTTGKDDYDRACGSPLTDMAKGD